MKKVLWQVHPDKTACFGAESAFKLVSQALTELAVANDRRSNAEEEDAQCSSDFWADAFQVDPEPPSKRQRHTSPDNVANLLLTPACIYHCQQKRSGCHMSFHQHMSSVEAVGRHH